MLPVDFHCHTTFSRCGIHSVMEMLLEARTRGLAGLAITDHGPELRSRVSSTFFERLRDPLPGIRMLRGIEANFCGTDGDIDVPLEWVHWMDIVLLGIHPNTAQGLGVDVYTRMVVTAIGKYPCIDILAHLNDPAYLVDFDAVARAASAKGVVVELNNSKTELARAGDDVTLALLAACERAKCRIAVNSDAHAINEVGCDSAARALIVKAGFPETLIVNSRAITAFAFVEERRVNKVGTAPVA